MSTLSVIIPTYNEASYIAHAIKSVSFAKEIIVIDSFSTDKTVAIVKESKAILLQREFDNFSYKSSLSIDQRLSEKSTFEIWPSLQNPYVWITNDSSLRH